MIKEIVTDIEKLSIVSDEINCRKDGKEVRNIVLDLKDTVRNKNLASLSAIQIGIDKRIFVLNFNGNLKSFVNPFITNVSGFEMSKEMDPSLPDKKYILPRYNRIMIVYQTPLGDMKNTELLGVAAKVFQQQVDHLEGILISDIGLEIDDDFENATEDEKAEIIKMYLESLDIKEKSLNEEIEKDEDLSKLKKNLDIRDMFVSGRLKANVEEKSDINANDQDKEK